MIVAKKPWGSFLQGVATLLLVVAVAACASTGGDAASMPDEPPPPAEQPPAVPPSAETAPSSPAAAYLAEPEAVARGSQLFRAVCTGYCHTTTGQAKKAPDLFDCASDHGSSDEEIHAVIVQGVPDTNMLPFDGKLPEEDLWKIVAYLRAESRCKQGTG